MCVRVMEGFGCLICIVPWTLGRCLACVRDSAVECVLGVSAKVDSKWALFAGPKSHVRSIRCGCASGRFAGQRRNTRGCGSSHRSADNSASDDHRCVRLDSRRLPSRRGMCSPPTGARSDTCSGIVQSTAHRKFRTLVRHLVASALLAGDGREAVNDRRTTTE